MNSQRPKQALEQNPDLYTCYSRERCETAERTNTSSNQDMHKGKSKMKRCKCNIASEGWEAQLSTQGPIIHQGCQDGSKLILAQSGCATEQPNLVPRGLPSLAILAQHAIHAPKVIQHQEMSRPLTSDKQPHQYKTCIQQHAAPKSKMDASSAAYIVP